jgi:hemolysin III
MIQSQGLAKTDGRVAVAEVRPLMRGTLHAGAALLAPAALVVLMLLADTPSGYTGAAIFASCLIVVYSTSAAYHLAPWPAALRGVMKRLDHAMIFALIAGTYTPFCLAVLGIAWGVTMLSVVWGIAGAGMLLKIAWPGAPRWLGVGLYLGVGWLALVATAEIIQNLEPAAIALLAAGGVIYSLGGIVYGLRRPDPFPRVFGFHEVFHACVVAGTALHYAVIAIWVL